MSNQTTVTPALVKPSLTTAPATLSASAPVPPVGTAWPEQGGIYAGILRSADGTARNHIIVAAKPEIEVAANWTASVAAAQAPHNGFADWSLFDRRESRLAHLNCPDQFDLNHWYWTATQNESAPVYAYIQLFNYGIQGWVHKSDEYLARAVRRLLIIE